MFLTFVAFSFPAEEWNRGDMSEDVFLQRGLEVCACGASIQERHSFVDFFDAVLRVREEE